MSEQTFEELFNNDMRLAWLEIGGYVAAADGLSNEEAESLAGSAAGPDLPVETCMASIQKGSNHASLPEDTVDVAKGSDIYIQLQCLSEIFSATGTDGVSDPEWARMSEVATSILGAEKSAAFIKVCELELQLDEARAVLLR